MFLFIKLNKKRKKVFSMQNQNDLRLERRLRREKQREIQLKEQADRRARPQPQATNKARPYNQTKQPYRPRSLNQQPRVTYHQQQREQQQRQLQNEREQRQAWEREKKERERLERDQEQQAIVQMKKEDKDTTAKILAMNNEQIEHYLQYRLSNDLRSREHGRLDTRPNFDTAEKFEEDTAFMQELFDKRQQDEDEKTEKKISEMDSTLLKKYLYYRESTLLRRFGSLGTRKYTDSVSNYNNDTEIMKERLQKVAREDDVTHRYIDKMTIEELEDYINKRKKWSFQRAENRTDGKLHTRKLSNTANNYKLDTKYMINRLINRLQRFKTEQTDSQLQLESLHSDTSSYGGGYSPLTKTKKADREQRHFYFTKRKRKR
jgi:hypothetical protein